MNIKFIFSNWSCNWR